MDIKAFIRELLFEHDCVIIPGFGGFIGNFYSSRIDKTTGTFYPPVRKISFNRNLNHNDGLLIAKISQSSGLNYGDARRLVEDFVKDLSRWLVRGETVVFDHIGSFKNNHENNVQFEPEVNANFHLDSYGFESFKCVPLKEYDVRRRVTRHIDRKTSPNYSARRILWRAAVIVPIVAFAVVIALKTDFLKSRVESSTLNPLVTAEFENNKKAVDEEISLAPDKGIQVSPVVPEEKIPEEQPVPVTVSEVRYGIITGSFKSEENALTHIEILKADGYDPEVVQASNGFYRVIAINCNSLEAAVIKKDSISKKFPGSWVSKR